MTEPSPTPEHDAAEERVHTPAPTPDTEGKEPKKDTKSTKKDFPVGQVAVGGLGAMTLGSYALASVVGPAGWLAAPAAGAVAGAGYVAYRRRKSRSGVERTKTTITRTRGSKSMRGGGLSGLRARGGGRSGLGSAGRAGGTALPTSAKRSGGLGASGRSGAGLGSSSARKGSGMGAGSRGGAAVRRTGGGTAPRFGSGGRRTSGGGLFGRGGSSPRSGGNGAGLLGRGAAPRSAKGGATPRGGSSSRRGGGGLLGRGSDASASKRKSTPPGGGPSPRTSGGSMPKNRWGGASGPTTGSKKPSRIRRSAARARDWADDKTGRRMSTGWKAARGQKGFKNRRRAAGQAVKAAGGGGIIAGIVGVIVAAFAGLASLFGWSSKDKDPKKDTSEEPTEKSAEGATDEKTTATGTGSTEPTDRATKSPTTSTPRGEHPIGFGRGPREPRPDFTLADTTPSTTTPTGGTTMSRNLPHATAAADLSALIAKHSPEDLFEVIDQADEWETWVQDTTMSIKRYVQQIQGKNIPLGKNSIQAIQELYVLQSKLMTAAQEIPKTMRAEHATDLERREHHRGDERLSNIR